MKTGNKLVEDNHYKIEEVKERMEAVTEAWTQLNEASAEKGKKLKEANDLQVDNSDPHAYRPLILYVYLCAA